jgi:sugar O-acyltransferase (sialic acid O-acetyltransferase NeuD family)
MKKPLIIFGAGGLGREVKTLVDALPDWAVSGFCDDHVAAGTMIMGVPVLGTSKYVLDLTAPNVVIAIGNPMIKRAVAAQLKNASGIRFITLVHPSAVLGDPDNIVIGEGSVITAGCILTTSIEIGKHVLINLNTTVGHDVTLGDYTSVMPGVNLAGEVTIGNNVMIGSGANILNRIVIGDDAIIGAGAVVLTDITSGATAVGVPAREVSRRAE